MPSRDFCARLPVQQRDRQTAGPPSAAFSCFRGQSSSSGPYNKREKKQCVVARAASRATASAAPPGVLQSQLTPHPQHRGEERAAILCSSSATCASSSSPSPSPPAARAAAAALFRFAACRGSGGVAAAAAKRRPALAAAAHLLLLLCLSSLKFLQPAAAVVFELRSGSSQCFYTPINQAPWSLQGRFESFVGEDTATLTVDGPVTSPDPKQPPPTTKPQMLFSSSRESAPFKLTITLPGTYRLCVTNRVNYTQTVALNFHLLPPAVAAGTSAAASGSSGGELGSSSSDGAAAALPPDMSTLVLSSHTDKLRDLSNKVVELANGLFDQQSTALARLSVYERLNSSTRSRATFWKVLQMGVQVVLSGIQVYAVRSRFEVKTIV